MAKKLIISVEGLSKQYHLRDDGGTVRALSDVSFEAYEGDKIGLIGLNGSGKSTLLKILSGHVKPSSGRATLYKDVQSLSHFDSLLHPDLSGTENIKLQLNMLSVPKTEMEAAITEIIEFSELNEFIQHPVKTYSSGMMLRLSFSIFKVVQPEILLLDEVFSAGDVVFRRKSEALIKKHLDQVSVIFMASHELQEIAKYCNRCIVLNHGKIEFNGSVDDAIQKYVENNEEEPKTSGSDQDVLELLLSELTLNRKSFKISEPITVNLKYLKKTDEQIDLVVYVRNNYGQVLTDCEIYRSEFVRSKQPIGTYELSFTIPPHLLNVGHYLIDLAFGNGAKDVLAIEGILKFEVLPDEWEKNRLWNHNPTIPIRPRLEWTKRLLS